eukprot:SAG11_NODE_32802_length_280_cov_7.403315_1_plen_66_part_00
MKIINLEHYWQQYQLLPVSEYNTDSSAWSIRFKANILVLYAEDGQYNKVEVEDPETQYGTSYPSR